MKHPKKVWLTHLPNDPGSFLCAFRSRKVAADTLWEGEIITGPYVLLEKAPKAKKKAKR